MTDQAWTELPKKLTPTLRRKISKDWQPYFPGLYRRKPMIFERRVGPLLVSIGFESICGGELYRPGFGVHNLCMIEDALYSILDDPLRIPDGKAADSLTVRWHEKNYRQAAERMVKQSLLPLEGPVSLIEVIKAYQKYVAEKNYSYITSYIEDPALIAAWAGEDKIAREALDWGSRVLSTWPEYAIESREWLSGWREMMEEKIANPAELRRITREEVEKHKLSKVPYEDFTDTSYKELEDN